MKIKYASLHTVNETHISFEAIKCPCKQKQEEGFSFKQKTNKRKNNVVRGFKRIAWESV
jgi:hypothetical protein